jgi:hypothetical protein
MHALIRSARGRAAPRTWTAPAAAVLAVLWSGCSMVEGVSDGSVLDARSADSADSAVSRNDAAPGSDAAFPVFPPDGGMTAASSMQLISRRVPAFSSNGAGMTPEARRGQDGDPLGGWSSDHVPAWIAYDLSQVPAAQRGPGLLTWWAIHSGSYVNPPSPPEYTALPVDYVVEVNTAPGGGSAPPSAGWTERVRVTNNLRGALEHAIALDGVNWIRMTVTRTTHSQGALEIDLDVYSAPNGATDSWLFMGDSITYMTMTYAFSDLPRRVNALRPERWPAATDGAIGGANSGSALEVIDEAMAGFLGRFVVLAYGTNDHPTGYEANMETLIRRVIAAGKVPVIPHIPWAGTTDASRLAEYRTMNQAIDALYARYPAVLRGPDLWGFFENRTDLIPIGDVHPTAAGQAALRMQWAATMAAVP